MKPVRWSKHAREEAERRGIPVGLVENVLASPEQVASGYGNTQVYQSRKEMGNKIYLIRVIVVESKEERIIVTVYRTTKVSKYWR
ncbi:MAG: DUF4258 domain-containing protein [candidate division WOR-3 bacterium]